MAALPHPLHKMHSRIALIAMTFLYSAHCYAIFCPTNFNEISVGDTTQQVETKCGKPTSIKTTKSQADVPQEWTYYLPMDPSLPGTMKVTFAFIHGQANLITSNGIGVGSTTICNNINLQIGSTIKEVKEACGTPAMITQSNLSTDQAQGTPSTEMAEWKYDATPPVTLVFEDGKLKERK